MNDVIRIVTTKGCEGCEIAINLVNKAIKQSTYTHIKVEIIDCLDDEYRQFINRYFKTLPVLISNSVNMDR